VIWIAPIFVFGLMVFGLLQIAQLPPWVAFPFALLFGVSSRYLLPRVLVALARRPLTMKSAVLQGAIVEFHSIEPISGDDSVTGGGTESPEDRELRFFDLDVTIRPRTPDRGSFGRWEPDSLMLVTPGTDVDPEGIDFKEWCEVRRVLVESEGSFVAAEDLEVAGPTRLRLRVAVKSQVRRLQFRYYFESFGEMLLPQAARAA